MGGGRKEARGAFIANVFKGRVLQCIPDLLMWGLPDLPEARSLLSVPAFEDYFSQHAFLCPIS